MKLFNKTKNNTKSLLFELPSGTRFAESYRTLRTNLNFSSLEHGLNSVVVSFSFESEGKASTAINLDYTIVQGVHKVLIIKGYLRIG